MQNEPTVFQKLLQGELPEVEVVAKVDNSSIINLSIALVAVFALCFGLYKIAK